MRVCIVQSGELREIPVLYNSGTGDTLTADSLPLSSVAPLTGEYASVAAWYVNDELIPFAGRRYRRSGGRRVLGIQEVVRADAYRGVPVFVETDDPTRGRVLYLPTRPGCEFQPYQDTRSAAARAP